MIFWPSLFPLFAVHISDGVLSTPWVVGGFALAAILLALSAIRVSDEEMVHIALLTSAFFVASLIHVRLGPTSVHLLLNGLVGVMLGWRAALAISVGLFLQAVLGHGGVSALGVNACVFILPAWLAWGLFHLLHRPAWLCRPWYRAGLVTIAVVLWSLTLVFSIVLIVTNRWAGRESLDPSAALSWTFNPLILFGVVLLAGLCAWVEWRLEHAPEFPLGLLLGLTTVLGTTTLNALAVTFGGAEDWHSLVLLVFVAHLPIAVIEGLILGFTLGFLSRVKPELLGIEAASVSVAQIATPAVHESSCHFRLPVKTLAIIAAICVPSLAHAHRLDADYKVLRDRVVQIESWFDLTGDPARGAKVRVLHDDGTLLIEGKVDEKGVFTFQFPRAEKLKVIVNAGAGHRRELSIPAAALRAEPAEEPVAQPEKVLVTSPDDEQAPLFFGSKKSWAGSAAPFLVIAFLLVAVAAVLSLRNARAARAGRNLEEKSSS